MERKEGLDRYKGAIDEIIDICLTQGNCKNCIFARYDKETNIMICCFETPPESWKFYTWK